MPRGLLISAALCLPLYACAPATDPGGWGPGAADGANPFAPDSMRIFPLTRLDRDADGKPMIVCHIEFRDAWGDSVKATGRLEIGLSGVGSGGPRQQLPPLNWDIDLADLERNASLYDRATRTYRIQLVDLPGALAAVPDFQEGAEPGQDAPAWRIFLRASLSSPAGGAPLLQDEYTLQP